MARLVLLLLPLAAAVAMAMGPGGESASAQEEPGGGRPPGVAERPTVQRIEFEGTLLYSARSLETRMRTKTGRPFDPGTLRADLNELRRYFQDIQVVQEEVAGGIVLRFLVTENPLVSRLRVLGAVEIEANQVREMIRTREGYPLSPYLLAQDREDLEAAYRLRGFHFVSVPEPRIAVLPDGGRQVDLTIVEGPKVMVRRILFRGAHAVERQDLIDVMRTEEPSILEELFDAPIFREDVLLEDLVALKDRYQDEGYLDAQVVLEDMRFSDDHTEVELTIAVEEGPLYRTGRIEVELERLEADRVGAPPPADQSSLTPERLRSLIDLREGQPWSGKRMKEGMEEIRDAYYTRSYLDARVRDPILRGRPNAPVVDVTLKVEEGAKFRLARIDFFGNEFTRDRILRRDVRTQPGGYVDRNELERGLQRLKRLGYFSRVTWRLEDAEGPDGEPLEGWKTATYEVVEGRTGQANFGAAVGTNGGFGVFATYTKRNFDITRLPTSVEDLTSGRAFTGAGQIFTIHLAPSTRQSSFSVRFREPRILDSHWGFDITGYRRIAFREGYDADRMGYRAGIDHPLYQRDDDTMTLTGRVEWRHELIDLDDVSQFAVPGAFLFSSEHELRGLGGELTLRFTDDILDPVHEGRTTALAEVVGGALGGDIDIYRLAGQHESVVTLYKNEEGGKHRLAFRGQVLYAEAFDDTPEVPPYERFFLGGQTLRGFAFRGVGAHANRRPLGGEFAWSSSLEYEFPIAPERFSLVAFVDAGAVEQNIDDFELDRTRIGVGLGLRIAIPFLTADRPIALDFGFAVKSEEEDEESLFSFSFGRTF